MTTEELKAQTEESTQQTTPVRAKKLGHVVFNVSDVERTTKFWTEIMGFKVSDRNERGMVFLRNGSDHHTIALAPAEGNNEVPKKGLVGFDHCALEVGSVSELFKIRDFLRSKRVTITYEGRKGPGCNPGIEFLDPDGITIELYASMDQIGWDGKSRSGEQWRRAKSLEEVIANPVEGVRY
ncbi:MAG: VOC family protein [Deltaproteobacteria bacterium]|nr:VOC family protein [Deltaproteobacteria bacterium]MCZ6451879.1 VOC family protein [Deltaproteobacteria bacterium]MCZ6548311.1 VOC family protein [Deltaproteobacteria bacterium]MCZ6563033.1 VOC family protein [Deltaproteobacteria bacterium]